MKKNLLIIFISICTFFSCYTSVNATTPLTCVYQKKEDSKVIWTFTRDSSDNVSFISGGGKVAKDTSYLNKGIQNSCPKNIYYAHNGTCSTMMQRFIVDKPKDVAGAEDICSYFTYELISTANESQSSNNNSSTNNSYIQADGSLRCVYHNDSTEWIFIRDSSGNVTFKSNNGKTASGNEISNLVKNIINDCPSNIYYTDEDCTTPKHTYGTDKPEDVIGSENICLFTKYNLVPDEYVDDDTEEIQAKTIYCGIFGEGTWKYIQNIYTIIKILIPALVIVLGMVDFMKVVFSGEEKDMKTAGQRFLKRIIAGIIFILLPVLLQFMMKLFGFSENCLQELIWILR